MPRWLWDHSGSLCWDDCILYHLPFFTPAITWVAEFIRYVMLRYACTIPASVRFRALMPVRVTVSSMLICLRLPLLPVLSVAHRWWSRWWQ